MPEPDLTPPQVEVVGDVRSHGWHVIGVHGDDRVPGWAYSIGLWHSYGQPEVSLFDLPWEVSWRIINDVGETLRGGAVLESGQVLDDVLANDYALAVREVHRSWYTDLFGQALAFYRVPPLPFLQLVWPDSQRRMPWEENAEAGEQPALWLPRHEHPTGPWTSLAEEEDWPFADGSPDQAVFTTKAIMAGEKTIVGVVHDRAGDWQFLDGGDATPERAALVHLRHIVDAHPFVVEFADLARGEAAWMGGDGRWVRSPRPPGDQDR